jgi:hypothetical protein
MLLSFSFELIPYKTDFHKLKAMKIYWVLISATISFVFFSCRKPTEKVALGEEEKYDCSSIQTNRVLYKIAKSVINASDNPRIWNLSDVDTAGVFITEDYFVSSKSKHFLIRMKGEAGLSSGNANNLLMIVSCSDGIQIIWSGQVGEFNQSDIKDLNNDGIKEIVIQAGMMWMGECNESFNIINFADGTENTIYSVQSKSVVDCGFDNLAERYKMGDTLENRYDCRVEYVGSNEYEVNQIHTAKINNGGQTDDEIISALTITSDSTRIKIK